MMWPRKRRPPVESHGRDTLPDAQQSSREAIEAIREVDYQLDQIHTRAARIAELSNRIEAELRRNGFGAAIRASMRGEAS